MADLDLSMFDINGNDIGLCYDLCDYQRYVDMGYYSYAFQFIHATNEYSSTYIHHTS